MLSAETLYPKDRFYSYLIFPDSLVDAYSKTLQCFYNNLPDSLKELRKIHYDIRPQDDSFNIVIMHTPGKYKMDPAHGEYGSAAMDSLLKNCGLVYKSEFHSRDDSTNNKYGGMDFVYDSYTFKTTKAINITKLQSELEKISYWLAIGGGTSYIGNPYGNFILKNENEKTFLEVYQTFRYGLGQWYQVKRVFDVTVPEKMAYVSYKNPDFFTERLGR
jgi:hypothetical protein